jgi:hypothetical protein
MGSPVGSSKMSQDRLRKIPIKYGSSTSSRAACTALATLQRTQGGGRARSRQRADERICFSAIDNGDQFPAITRASLVVATRIRSGRTP